MAENDGWDLDETEDSEEQEQDVVPYRINYYPADITLRGYLDKFDKDQLEIPAFQRRYVWDRVRASKLIESFLLGLPVPGVFLYKDARTNKLSIIDGQQRILTVVRYYQNEFGDRKFPLEKVLPKWSGKTYGELDEADRFQLDDTVLRATIIQQVDPNDDSSIYHIFERLNTGGMNLTPMEIRRCVFSGGFFSHLDELNKLPSWRQLLAKPEPDKRFRDVELVLRVIALQANWRGYEKPMKRFLNGYMSRVYRLDEAQLKEEIARTHHWFTATSDALFAQLGPKPFHLRGRLNYAALDSTMSAAWDALSTGVARPLKDSYAALVQVDEFLESASKSTSDERVLKQRFELAHNQFCK